MPLRSILKNQPVTNLISLANDKMLRELEQIVEERDRLKASIEAVPSNFSQLSPRSRSAQKLYVDDILDQMEQINVLIEDKYILLKETLSDADMVT
ncbi:hypothetical protein PRIPAC_78883 [Pristionchus pacificus]|uniref:Uncharacterized protein n=1 Tax=Pristionchus pacificus TaxID=54126 RepID=A0A2A6C2L1_PRIPA|nr:hypothetical protein PRIPAC_78883 [Pristionchus pacificus]|eukprot:PDM72327.1 hypothetical protein PRIPAC_38761 [Pristionchus pacificus]